MITWAYWKNIDRFIQSSCSVTQTVQDVADYFANPEYPDFILFIGGSVDCYKLGTDYYQENDIKEFREEFEKFRESWNPRLRKILHKEMIPKILFKEV